MKLEHKLVYNTQKQVEKLFNIGPHIHKPRQGIHHRRGFHGRMKSRVYHKVSEPSSLLYSQAHPVIYLEGNLPSG